MILEIKPLDTLFFRDGKPFNKDGDTWADTIFPPYPSTIYGALRTAWFNENIEEFEKLNKKDFDTEKDPTEKLKINNIVLKNGNDFLFPMPMDILQSKGEEEQFKRLSVANKDYLTSAGDIKLLINQEDEIYSYKNCMIPTIDFEDYLNNDISSFEKPIEDIFQLEPKVGITREIGTHSAKDGHLYRVGMLRLNNDIKIYVERRGYKRWRYTKGLDIKIYVDFEGLELKNTIFLKLGGEGKFVEANKTDKKLKIPFPKVNNNKFILYLSTPAIFEKGWIPSWIDEDKLEGTIPHTDLEVKLISATIGKPRFIGGFDMAKKEPKPMYKAVPEGSVYYFEILSGNKESLKEIHGKSVSDVYGEQGFGVCYAGKY